MNFLVTGGASGLGKAIVTTLATRFQTATIYFTFFRSSDAAAVLEKAFSNVKGVQCDFTARNQVDDLCSFIQASNIEVLVNNAYTQLSKQYFHKTAITEISDSFTADVLATLAITQSFLVKARERKSGRIITILTSALTGVPPAGWSVYLANKSYLLAMTRAWAAENKSFNVVSNSVSPDFMATPIHGDMDERVIENMVKAHPLKKLLTVEEVGETVAFLAQASLHLNGQNIVMNAAASF